MGVGAWLQSRSFFRYGAAASNVGLHDRGVFAYASLEGSDCPHSNNAFCSRVQVLLCGSKQHVRDHRGHPPARMGSGSDWLHALAADLTAREGYGDTSLPERLNTTSIDDQEFAARSAYSMISHFYRTPGYLSGHARVLCNFPSERLRHRLIVATPLYVETGLQPTPTIEAGQESRVAARWRHALRNRRRFGFLNRGGRSSSAD
ncbi:SAVMC3_10250 family protein [Streptomyces sp. NRRL F-5755]|uniref:SAVMC3_10250 family protein n=1 Tax=Streptomyces sp. NRRL F-5755 TaxID=1519475 RepID=UPI0022771C2C|nr:SAVMC3_10250 family protein [Streptomyces sp. NRRL F-5755]